MAVAIHPYNLEQAETDIANLRHLVDLLSEVLTQNDVTDAPNTPASGLIRYSSSGQGRYASSDGNNYNTGRLTLYNTGSQLISSTSQATITGLSCPVVAGTYAICGKIIWIQGATQAQQALRVNGPAASNMRVTWTQYEESTVGESVFASNATAINTDSGTQGTNGQPNGAVVVSEFDGVITFSASGTLSIDARCVTNSADTYTIQSYSFMHVMPVTTP